MPRARTATAASRQEGSGCFTDFIFVPLVVILTTAILAYFALQIPRADVPPAAAGSISPIFTKEIQHWAGSISQWAAASSLDPNLIATIMQIESCGDPRARSTAGAMGLFQVMPFHFQAFENPYQPEVNALRGLNYLKRSYEAANGNIRKAMAGYNGGIGVMNRPEWQWPAETQRYVRFGEPIYSEARSGVSSSTALQDWYENYGVSLCKQASERLGLR